MSSDIGGINLNHAEVGDVPVALRDSAQLLREIYLHLNYRYQENRDAGQVKFEAGPGHVRVSVRNGKTFEVYVSE